LPKFIVRLAFIGLICGLAACTSLPKPGIEVQRLAEIEIFFNKWNGTDYLFGGSSSNGLDCSALMVKAYDEVFNLKLPRTTESQSGLGKWVSKNNLKAGDLVFFKTGVLKRHVGIYLENRIFVHASQSNGVIKSSLDSGYWRKHYWKAKRLIN
jgi:cell wall-associated NlpC family hydrolase